MSKTPIPNILVVDDQELMYRVLQATLRPLGARLSWSKSGAEAIAHIKDLGAPEVMVLDFSMPDQDGVETLRQIRELATGAAIPVVMLTARDQTQIREDAADLKVHSFMTKPFSPNLLLSTIKQILQNSPKP
jgi:CheY-like chemotaxis protein